MSREVCQIYSTSEEAWHAMYDAILSAQKSIYWEVYILIDDEVGKKFFNLLEKKSKEGVDVKLIIDGIGSFSVSKSRIEKLKKSGVDIRIFHERKHRYRGLWSKMISRTHRKILVIDQKIGFIGGVNVQKHMKEWLDIHVKIEGKAVRSLLRAFAKIYLISGGDKKNVKHLLRYKFRVKGSLINFIYDDADNKRSKMRKKYTEALLKARERVILFSPYYFPDRKLIKALWKAKRRGVRVDLLIPFRTDVRLATYAAYAWLAFMAKAGVNIHLSDKMMHGKGVIVDDEWAIVGSSNIEHGSFYNYYEANVKIEDKLTVKKLKGILTGWINTSKKFDRKAWRKRSKWQRFKENIAYRLYRIWHSDKNR